MLDELIIQPLTDVFGRLQQALFESVVQPVLLRRPSVNPCRVFGSQRLNRSPRSRVAVSSDRKSVV